MKQTPQNHDLLIEFLENSPLLFLLFEPGFKKIIYANKAVEKYFSIDAESFIADPRIFIEKIHPEDQQIYIQHKPNEHSFQFRIQNGNDYIYSEEYRFVIKNGKAKTLHAAIIKIENHSDNSHQQMEFLAMISHELRTPLNAILGITKTLETRLKNTDLKQYIDIISNSGKHLLSLSNHIIDFAQLEGKQVSLQLQPINLRELVSSVIRDLALQFQYKDIDIWLNYDNNAPTKFILDELRIRQILINLISNALKYTLKGHVIVHITAQTDDEQNYLLKIIIEDSGKGIAKDKLDFIFKRFTRIESESTKSVQGIGLGLAIVKQLADLLNAKISVESEENHGSKFSLEMKAFRAPSDRKFLKNYPALKIVLLDQQPSAGFFAIKNALSHFNLELQNIENIDEFLAKEKNIDIVLIDDQIPWRNFLDKVLRLQTLFPKILFIVLARPDKILPYDIKFFIKPLVQNNLEEQLLKMWRGEQTPVEKNIKEGIVKILLVEDNIVNQKVIKLLLDEKRYQIDFANSGKEALNLLPNKYDCILMDLNLPDMNGYDITKAIRKIPQYTTTPIIALTAHALLEDREKCLAVGMNEILIKPVEKKHLEDLIERWI